METWHICVTCYTPVKKIPNWKSLLLCHLFDTNVGCNGGYYNLVSENAQELKIFERISTLFTVDDDNLSVGPHICKTCYQKIEKFKATFKEGANLNWEYCKKNLVYWKGDASNGENTHSKCCSSSSGTPASGALCSSTQCSGSRWQNRQNILAANEIRNSIPLLGALKVERFEELSLWLWPDLDLSRTLQHANKHQAQNPQSTIITSPSDISGLTFSILRNQSPCLLD